MTGAPHGVPGQLECRIGYHQGQGPVLPPADVARLCRFAQSRSRDWGTRICQYLGLDLRRRVKVTLRPGTYLSMTRGNDVVIGVDAGTVSAALAHELVHAVVGPSPRQVYAEGLAVHVDSRLRLAGPAWPFFDLDPDRWVRHFVDDGSYVPLALLMAAPRALPSAEEGMSSAARIYLEAASLVAFVVHRLGLEGFWPYFRSGRPIAATGPELDAMEQAWLAGLGGPLTDAELRCRDAALARVVDDGRHGVVTRPDPTAAP